MKIACAQLIQIWDDVDAAFSQADTFLSENSCKADMVMFSEQYATGWRPSASAVSGVGVRDHWLALAAKHKVCVVGSYQKLVEGSLPQNTMLVCGPSGEILAEYSKMYLFAPGKEDRCFSAGDKSTVFTYGGVKFGCAICFDLRFPELFREYLRLGCECVLVQAAWPAARVADWELLLRARALENRGYMIGAACLGYDPVSGTDYCGRSMICDYEGRVIGDGGVFEGGCAGEVDVDGVRKMRKEWGIPTLI
jgi:predicted amidohydrolase